MTDTPTWEDTLDALESHLLGAEALLSGHVEEMPDEPWLKPDGLGPLPPRLVDRAMALRERHAAVLAAVAMGRYSGCGSTTSSADSPASG